MQGVFRLRGRRYTKQMTDRDVLPPWRRGSHFQKLEERLQRFQADLPTRLRFDRDTLLELYAENRGQLTPFIHMHVWISQLFCDLYRSTMPGLENAAPPSYLADSPPGWSEFIARLCFESAQQIARKLGMVDRLFPDFIHRDDIIAINVFESVRNQIGHVFALDPLAQDVEAWDEIRADVVPMMRFVRRTLPIHYSARSTVSHDKCGLTLMKALTCYARAVSTNARFTRKTRHRLGSFVCHVRSQDLPCLVTQC